LTLQNKEYKIKYILYILSVNLFDCMSGRFNMEQRFFKKQYSAREAYTALYRSFRTAKYMGRSRKEGLLDPKFTERIMLAVTEVNGCEVCSYFHAKLALESGISNEELQSILSGDAQNTPPEQSAAILFAQHYADTRGTPSQASWDRIIKEYGEKKALGILGSIRIITVGNIFGIPLSALKRRLKGKPVPKSNPFYEIGMLLWIVPCLPAAALHAFLSSRFKKPVISF
jgi:AhpD family alkylhydroperoxidase